MKLRTNCTDTQKQNKIIKKARKRTHDAHCVPYPVKLFKYDCYVFMTGCIRFRAQPPRPLVPATVRVPATATTSASSLAAAAPLHAAPSSSPPRGPSPSSSSSPLTGSDRGSAVPRGGRVIPAASTSVLPAASHGPLPRSPLPLSQSWSCIFRLSCLLPQVFSTSRTPSARRA